MIHPHGYWLEVQGANTHICDQSLCDAIIEMFPVESAIDIGSGDGAYTRNLINAGIKCKGFDGNPETYKISSGLCNVRDFSQPVRLGKFDLVLSLEVGEHIPRKYEQTFINNLCRASQHWICGSWGVEGQTGYGHVNCRNNDYIIKEFKKRGFKFREDLSEIIRNKSTLEWFHNTIMVFEI